MDSKTHRLRIPCNSLCVVIYQGIEYRGMIENVSLTGTLVCLQDFMPPGIQVGDECGLLLCSDPSNCPARYTCRVIRVDSGCIGLEFVELG